MWRDCLGLIYYRGKLPHLYPAGLAEDLVGGLLGSVKAAAGFAAAFSAASSFCVLETSASARSAVALIFATSARKESSSAEVAQPVRPATMAYTNPVAVSLHTRCNEKEHPCTCLSKAYSVIIDDMSPLPQRYCNCVTLRASDIESS